MTQEVVIYRNPGEAAVWHALQSAHGFAAMCSVVVFLVVLLVLMKLFVKKSPFHKQKLVAEICLGVSGLAGIGTFIYMTWRL